MSRSKEWGRSSRICDRISQAPAPLRILLFLSLLVLSWLPVAVPCYWFIHDKNLVSIVTLILLYGEFLGWLYLWGRKVDRRLQVWRPYGLWGQGRFGWDWVVGFALAASCLGVLFFLEGQLGWLKWHLPASSQSLGQLMVEGCLVGVGIGVAEELFFRGWLLTELEQSYSPQAALFVNSFMFATLHFIKPLPDILKTLPQFAGLFVLGLILVWARWATQGRLGLSMGLHAGLVGSYYWVNVGQLIQYTHQAPIWVTGINNNPLAGLAGISALGLLALMVRYLAQGSLFKAPQLF